jgi:aminopeptidase N
MQYPDRARVPVCLLLLQFVTTLALNAEEHALHCARAHNHAAPIDSSSHRKFAPDRTVDITHVALDITPDFARRSLDGRATLRLKPLARPATELRLDAVELQIHSVESSHPIQRHQVLQDALVITFTNPLPADQEASVSVRYAAEPKRGLFFRTPDMGYPAGDTHIWTQGEPIDARFWFPCFDAPNEKFTSEVTCRVPQGMTVLSNGRKIAEAREPATGLVRVTWLQDKPHVTYLITLCAGYFQKIEDTHGNLSLAFWTPPSMMREAQLSFRGTKDMMAFFEREIGVPYPWHRYDQVVIEQDSGFGMEHTSQTTLGAGTLFTSDFETIRSSQGLVAHELAHQWFGDLVTCKDWTHLWLNEGFATYYDALYAEHADGHDEFLLAMLRNARTVLGNASDTTPIAHRSYERPDDQFSFRAYPKGAWVLHMLRHQLGPDLYRRTVKTFVERHQFDTIVTEDFNAVLEELSGRSFDQFFDQWVYHAGVPELTVNYSWDEKHELAQITVAQTQKLSADVVLFNFPLQFRFKTASGTHDREVLVKEKQHDFAFALPEAPSSVRVDPHFALLARVRFKPATPLLLAQLEDPQDVIGRILACEQLADARDKSSIAKLQQRLNTDPFYGVRLEAARALRQIHSDDAFLALEASMTQADARVRHEVVQSLAGFYRPETARLLREVLQQEKNPAIAATALRALGGYHDEAAQTELLGRLTTPSYRGTIARAAIGALRTQDDPRAIAPLASFLATQDPQLTAGGIADGLAALAFLARNETNRAPTREFLLGHLRQPREQIRIGAIRALGDLGDPAAIPALQGFANASSNAPERAPAETAIKAIREKRPPPAELGQLRDDLIELQKANRDLRKELDELKRKLEALAPPKPPAPVARTQKPRRTPKP